MEEYDYLFKVIVLGDGGAGKTALTVRFSQGYFQESYKMTVGVDFSVKLIDIPTGSKVTKVKLQTWDTGGQERFSFVRPLYYRGAMGAMLVFDVTNRESFDHLPNWIEELQANAEPVPFVLVGNKVDLPRTVSPEEAWDFAKQFGIRYYYETSAKTGEAVGDCFYALAHEMMGIPLPTDNYPAVMHQLGLVPGSAPAPALAPAQQPVAASVPVPEPGPAMVAGDTDFASEYGDYEETVPVPQPVARPLPKPAPLPAPVAKPVPVAIPRPVAAQPVPVARSLPKPVAAVVPQPLPKPMSISVPEAQPVPRTLARPQAIGLFQSSGNESVASAPMEVPELPTPKPVAARLAKPIPRLPQAATSAAAAPAHVIQPVASAQQAPAPTPAAAGPVIFQPRPQATTPLPGPSQSKSQGPQPDSRSSASFNFTQALAAKSKSATAKSTGSGAIPFSSGFTAAKPAGSSSGGGSGAMNYFIQTSVPENVLNLKKEKKKKKAPGEPSDLIKCPGCGYSVSNKMRFCNKCGTKLK